jgi:hypothetical protein
MKDRKLLMKNKECRIFNYFYKTNFLIVITIFMKSAIIILLFITTGVLSCRSQSNNNSHPARKDISGMAAAANDFLQTLSANQKEKIQFDFDADERYNWHYIPKSRKGLPLKELTETQQKAAMALLHTALSDTGFEKSTAIMRLEAILKDAEARPADDDYRDPGKYYFSVFGNPATDSIWGWRLEGHHISFIFLQKTICLFQAHPVFSELILPLCYRARERKTNFKK